MNVFMDSKGIYDSVPPVEIVLDRTAFVRGSLLTFDYIGRLMQRQNIGLWCFSFLVVEPDDFQVVDKLKKLRFSLVNVYDDLLPESRQALLLKLWSESYRAIVCSPLVKAKHPDINPRLQSPDSVDHLLRIMERFEVAQAPFTLSNYSRFFAD